MPLGPGTRLGPYEILSAIGAGGMGEVYRARDTKLDRDVAIKVLPEAFAADPERIARFQREAKTLASLNHPHIAGIYRIASGAPRRCSFERRTMGPSPSSTSRRRQLMAGFAVSINGWIWVSTEGKRARGSTLLNCAPSGASAPA